MSAFARASERLALAGGVLGLWLCAALPLRAEPPARVVSMNLCTDQLAMTIAAPGQLVSVSWLAAEPALSAMAAEAAGLPANRGRAEEIHLLAPDLVLADVWSSPATVSMLRRLGLEVVQFTPGASMEELRANITRMGAVLGREAKAAEVLAAFDARLAALEEAPARRPRAAIWGANAYTQGSATLAGQVMRAAGFDNLADELGLAWGGTLPLESLVMAAPDLILTERPGPGPARAEEGLTHPALAHLPVARGLTGPDWACATPHLLDAVERLAAERRRLEAGG